MPPKTKDTEPAEPLVEEDQAAAEQFAAGSVVRLADNERLALLVGYTSQGHPLVVDLPDAREHHLGVVRA